VNNFAEIIPVEELSGGKVRFYTVRYKDEDDDGERQTEFQSFLERCCAEKPPSFATKSLLDLLTEMGVRGAKSYFFREENKALRVGHREIKTAKKLRLYCYRLHENAVILLGGAVKTDGVASAQDCPVVAPYFSQAQQIAKSLDKLMLSRELQWDEKNNKLIYPDEFSF
jgi:hypothetical protein